MTLDLFLTTKRTICLVLPYPPSANRYWRVRVMKGVAMTYVSTEAKQYKRDVALLVRTKELFTGDVQLAIDIYRPLKSGDLSNRIKVLEDALKGICYIDDKQVKTIFARRFDDKAWPRAEVTITEL